MKQIRLAVALIAAPIGAFTAFNVLFIGAAAASLGDLMPLKTIVADVQKIAAAGDFKAAEARVTDFETAWDDGETGMRLRNSTAWGNIDEAADKEMKSLRRGTPSVVVVTYAPDLSNLKGHIL